LNPIAFDTETFYSKKLKCTVFGNLPEEYVSHELFDCYMVSVCDGTAEWSGHPRDFNWNALEGRTLLSHNRRFDNTVTNKLIADGKIPRFTPKDWHCTANLTSYLCNRRALDAAVEWLYKIKISKADRTNAEGKRWPNDFSEEERKRMLEYAKGDVRWCSRIWQDFSHKMPYIEHRLSDLTIEQGMRGAQINAALLDEFISRSHEMLANTVKLIPWMQDDDSDLDTWDEFNTSPTSTKCIAEQCRRSGINPPPAKSKDAEAYEEWETAHKGTNPWIQAVSAWRSINKLYKSFLLVKRRLTIQDVMPFSLKYFGAHCFTGDHEVLTPEGWVRLDSWSGGKIMQWENGKLRFDDAIANRFENASGENLLECKSKQLNFVCTEGHWLATLNKKGEVIKRQAAEASSVRLCIPISGCADGAVSVLPYQIKLMAAVQADGSYCNDCRTIRFRFSKLRKIERLRSLLKEAGLKWSEAVYPSEPKVTNFRVPNYPDWLENRKQWTSELLTWDLCSRLILLDELVHWDGYKCGPKSVEYSTSSKSNAEWVATIAHISGRAASISIRDGNEKWAANYRVFIRSEKQTRVSPKHWINRGPAGEVFCPTAKTGIILIRYRGTISISSNTGRWSGDARINMQNMRKIPVFCNEFGLMEMNDRRCLVALDEKDETGKFPDWVKYTLDFRALIVPRPGKKMILSDLRQIEPRVLAMIAGNKNFLDLVATGMSPYEAHARSTMKYSNLSKLEQTDPVMYKLAKARVLGLGFGCGWEKFITVAYNMARLDITKDDPEFCEEPDINGKLRQVSGYGKFSREIVTKYRADNPQIVDLWEKLDDAFKRSIGTDFVMTLPSGRQMRYSEVKASLVIKPDPETGKPRKSWKYTALSNGNRKPFYGGKLTENLVQATARDIFAEQIVRMEDKDGWTNLFSSHDEAILEVDQSVTAKDVEHEMSYCPEWFKGCPIAAEAREVDHYLK